MLFLIAFNAQCSVRFQFLLSQENVVSVDSVALSLPFICQFSMFGKSHGFPESLLPFAGECRECLIYKMFSTKG